jgi:hypothetical protein
MVALDFIDPDSKLLEGTAYSCDLKLPVGFYEYKFRMASENASPVD